MAQIATKAPQPDRDFSRVAGDFDGVDEGQNGGGCVTMGNRDQDGTAVVQRSVVPATGPILIGVAHRYAGQAYSNRTRCTVVGQMILVSLELNWMVLPSGGWKESAMLVFESLAVVIGLLTVIFLWTQIQQQRDTDLNNRHAQLLEVIYGRRDYAGARHLRA